MAKSNKQKLSKGGMNGQQKSDKVEISANSISINNKTGARRPMTKTSRDSTVLTHTETYGVNILGTANFSNFATFALQPGITTYNKGSPLGQWLPQIAGNFDNYEIISLKFTYRSACSTLEPGLVIFGFEPNPEGTLPTSYQELRNMYSVDGSVHANLTFDVSKLVRKSLLIRKRAVINLPSYDAGKVYVATIGCTDAAKLGFVDVSYSIRLFNPQAQNSSTDIVPYTFQSPFPVQRIVVNSVPSSSTINAATDACSTTSLLLSQTLSSSGAPLASIVNVAIPALNLNFGGMKFVDSATNRYHLQCAYTGRYRINYTFNVDFQDLKLFSSAVFTRLPGSAWTIAQEQVVLVTDGSSPTYISTLPIGHRGFTGTAALDPDPATDLPMCGCIEFSMAATSYFTIAVGVQEYNSVSTTTANVKFVSGRGYPLTIDLVYLGPLQPS
jgi:hypothetical protein